MMSLILDYRFLTADDRLPRALDDRLLTLDYRLVLYRFAG